MDGGLTYVIASSDLEWVRWLNTNPTDDGSSRHDVVRVRSWRMLEGRRFFPQDRLELTGTWWNRADLREIVAVIRRSIALRPLDDAPMQILGVIEPLLADWHRTVAHT